MDERVKGVAVEEAARLKSLTSDAVNSGAYLYPLRGIFYFLSHRALWKPLVSRLVPTLSLGAGITTALFLFTYLPQMAVLAFTSGPLAPFSAGLLILSESSTLTTFLSKSLLINDALLDTFDGTLISKNTSTLVSQGRVVNPGTASSDPINRLGKAIKKPFVTFTPTNFIRYIMYLPLNFIPVVGTVMFVLLQGKKTGPGLMERYFQLKGWGRQQKERHVESYRGAYTSFGVAATLLEMVPIAGILFSFSNTCSAALWAADMEKGNVSSESGTSPDLREKVKQAE